MAEKNFDDRIKEVVARIAEEFNSALPKKINTTGDRGSIAGYETVGTSTDITQDSPDANEVNSDITVANGTYGTCWTKIVRFTMKEEGVYPSVTLGSSWVWENGAAPDNILPGGILVLCWCGSGGMASFNSPE